MVVATIEAMTSLTEVGLFPDYMQCELLADTAPLLIHPNLWIRHVSRVKLVIKWSSPCLSELTPY